MPSEAEIETFCVKVRNGDIYVEYDTHYYEFNSESRYVDDWEVHHNDPKNVTVIRRNIKSCMRVQREGRWQILCGWMRRCGSGTVQRGEDDIPNSGTVKRGPRISPGICKIQHTICTVINCLKWDIPDAGSDISYRHSKTILRMQDNSLIF